MPVTLTYSTFATCLPVLVIVLVFDSLLVLTVSVAAVYSSSFNDCPCTTTDIFFAPSVGIGVVVTGPNGTMWPSQINSALVTVHPSGRNWEYFFKQSISSPLYWLGFSMP